MFNRHLEELIKEAHLRFVLPYNRPLENVNWSSGNAGVELAALVRSEAYKEVYDFFLKTLGAFVEGDPTEEPAPPQDAPGPIPADQAILKFDTTR